MAEFKPMPVITSGRAEQVGRVVMQNFAPEVEVIHFVIADSAETEIPLLLTGKIPDPPSSKLGSGNWESAPKAVVLGGAYQEADVERLQGLVHKAGGRQIPWLRVDSTKPGSTPGTPEYAAEVAQRCKAELLRLDAEGKLGDIADKAVYLV